MRQTDNKAFKISLLLKYLKKLQVIFLIYPKRFRRRKFYRTVIGVIKARIGSNERMEKVKAKPSWKKMQKQ